MVTGGIVLGQDVVLDSTELLVEGAISWTSSGSLPTPRWAIAGAILDNKIIVTGNTKQNVTQYSFTQY